jgi:dihydroorotate dehydrogenase
MVCREINQGIARYLQAHGFASVSQLVGTLSAGADTQDCAISG